MNNRQVFRHHAFIESFVDAVTVRPFLDDLSRVRRAANLRASFELLRSEIEGEEPLQQAA